MTSQCKKETDPDGHVVQGAGLPPLACWEFGFESAPRNGSLSLVNVVCCQVEVSATGRSLVQRSPTDCVRVIVITCGNDTVHLQYTEVSL